MSPLLLLLLVALPLSANFEQDLPNLRVPTNLKPMQLMVDVQHRFLPNLGAGNVTLGLRYLIWSKLEVQGGYTWYHYALCDNARDESQMGVSYAVVVPGILRLEPGIQYFAFKQNDTFPKRRRNIYGQLALETEPIFKTLKPVVNVGYDAYDLSLGVGAGLNASFNLNLGPVRGVDLGVEYFPRLSKDPKVTGMNDAFAASVTLETYGHHFALVFGNSLESGSRRLMLGAQDRKLYFGFNVHRFLDLRTL